MKDSLTKDVKAQLYQRLSEIESLLPPGSESEIQISEDQRDPKKSKFVVDIKLKSAIGIFKARQMGPDVFQAVTDAKNKIVRDIEGVYQQTQSTSDRSAVVDSMMRGPWLH